jgi:hypothetical protein
MKPTLQDRIRERTYHLLNNWRGQSDDNHYWLKERAVGTAGGSWLLALQRRAGSLKGRKPVLHLPDIARQARTPLVSASSRRALSQ